MTRNVIHTSSAPAAVGPYSQGISIGNLLYTAGQASIDPAIGKMIEGDISAQTEQTLRNIGAILQAGGTDFAHVVKTTVFLTDMGNFAAMNAVYASFFGENPPARTTVAVVSLPPAGALVEIEAVAIIPG